jgi:hypothetical protein
MGHPWSLVIKDHSYLLLPILLSGPSRSNCKKEEPFATIPHLFLAIGLPAWRYGNFTLSGATFRIVPFTPLRLDRLFADFCQRLPMSTRDFSNVRNAYGSASRRTFVHSGTVYAVWSAPDADNSAPQAYALPVESSLRGERPPRRRDQRLRARACAMEFLMSWPFLTLAMAFWSLAPNRDGNGSRNANGAFATNRSGTANVGQA